MKKIKAAFTKKVLTAIIIIGVLAILMMYAFVFTKYSEKTEVLKASNQQLSTRVAELKGYYDKQAQYEKDIALIDEIVTKLMEDYPADTRPEDVVMLAVELQGSHDILISNINMEDNELVYDVPKETVVGAKIEGFDENLQFMKKKASYAVTLTLNIFIEGNLTAKANTTANVKLTIKK